MLKSMIRKRFITSFLWRHIGPSKTEIQTMLDKINISDTDELVKKTIPNNLLMEKFRLGDPMSPHSLITLFEEISEKNNTEKTYFGQGYYPTITPSFIMRNLLGNPAWYSPYTPYQSEISQGRLESLYNYQLMITELTKLPISNSSLLDEGSSASEAMIMCYNILGGKRKDFIVDPFIFKQTMDVVYTIAEPLGINIIVCDYNNITKEQIENSFGVLIQYPNSLGDINNFTNYECLVEKVKESGSKLITATDLMALSLIKSPGELGADIAIGNCQRLGVPMYYGGPHAAFISAKKEFMRFFPGKIVAKSIDVNSNRTYRLAAQTREQHIKREKATSNICTAQCLLANVSAMYAIYHGPEGLKDIAKNINKNTAILEKTLSNNGFEIINTSFFDTITVTHPSKSKMRSAINKNIFKNNIDGSITISIDETVTLDDVRYILKQFGILHISNYYYTDSENYTSMLRNDEFMTQSIFNINKSETNLLRYIKRLEEKDLSLIHSMIPLGSCTMKLNSSASLTSMAMNGFKNLHPYSPDEFSQGYFEILKELTHFLTKISGMDTTCLQPNSGSQGEYTGLRMIKKYIDDKYGKDSNRNICLIPESAHGTNPASAAKAGLKVVVIKTKNGEIDIEDLNSKISLYDNRICCLMITYPSTYGFFESNIVEVCHIIHNSGGQIYLDGANMNAQVGLSNLGGHADVMHFNLHKTFGTPHGGGGPGSGPISLKKHLIPYLPNNHMEDKLEKSIGCVTSTNYGSAALLPVAWGYIKMLGGEGLKMATKIAILNANYMAKMLEPHYTIMFRNENGMVAHEFIIDLKPFSQQGITPLDVTKRLQDYGYHAPTVSWPVPDSLMIEPTESENLDELNRFCNVLINIKKEVDEIKNGTYDKKNNVLKNAPHTLFMLMQKWDKPYSKDLAFYPLPYLHQHKFWPRCGRIDEVKSDREFYNLTKVKT